MLALSRPVELFVLLGVDMLDVCHHQVAHVHQLGKRAKVRLVAREWCKRGVEAGIDAAGFCFGEKIEHELGLKQSFAARDGNAALRTPVATVALGSIEKLVGFDHLGAFCRPSVGVVAIAATHRAALEENDKAHAGAVGRAK